MADSEALRQFLEDYQSYVRTVLRPTRDELKALFKRWTESDYWSKYAAKSRLPNPSPIQRTFARIKRPESVVDKILRKAKDFPDSLSPKSFRRMYDALGARVIVYFLSHLPLIDQELRNLPGVELSSEFPPVAYLSEEVTRRLSLTHLKREDKESGYASVHYVIRLTNSKVPVAERPWVELQVRTLSEDVWGEIEHILGYKPGKRTSFAVRKQFQIIGRLLSAIDEHFNFLYEELARFQEEVAVKDSDPLNAENIAVVLDGVGIGCAQREIDGMLKLLVSRGVSTVRDLREAAIPSMLEIIRNTYRSELGRLPGDFEVVACLGAMRSARTPAEQVDHVRAQIAYLHAWDMLKGDNLPTKSPRKRKG